MKTTKQQSTTQKSSDSTKTSNSDSSKYKIKQIRDTIFYAVLEEETEKYRIIIGNKIVSQYAFDTIEEVTHYVDSKPWELITIALIIFADSRKEDIKQEILETLTANNNKK